MPAGNEPEVEVAEGGTAEAAGGAGGTADDRGVFAEAAVAEALSEGDREAVATLLPELRAAAESGGLGNPRKSAGWIGIDTDR
mmetsp:Transcript_145758/g.271435  ORF Transcript_145758/g.271435 Transcript_145758/m.271435 type:complete len:83 (+) Transcript_145758:517-765(+)